MTLFGLGGQSVLQHGEKDEAIEVIQTALDQGVNYFDTSPKYGESELRLGEALEGRRESIFLASKTHARDAAGSMKLMESSLRRLRTNHLDLWQLHSVGGKRDLEQIFAPQGAYQALMRAKEQGLTRFVGLTGHYDPDVLLEAIGRERFDCLLIALNAADIHHRPFRTRLLAAALDKKMGVIGMKVPARGKIFRQKGLFHPAGVVDPADAFNFVWTLGVSGIIVGCDSVSRVGQNVELAKNFRPISDSRMAELESMTRRYSRDATWFKNWNGVPAKRIWYSAWT